MTWEDLIKDIEKENVAWHKAMEPLLLWLDSNYYPPQKKPKIKKCPNVNEEGVCPLHNIHCNFPNCTYENY